MSVGACASIAGLHDYSSAADAAPVDGTAADAPSSDATSTDGGASAHWCASLDAATLACSDFDEGLGSYGTGFMLGRLSTGTTLTPESVDGSPPPPSPPGYLFVSTPPATDCTSGGPTAYLQTTTGMSGKRAHLEFQLLVSPVPSGTFCGVTNVVAPFQIAQGDPPVAALYLRLDDSPPLQLPRDAERRRL